MARDFVTKYNSLFWLIKLKYPVANIVNTLQSTITTLTSSNSEHFSSLSVKNWTQESDMCLHLQKCLDGCKQSFLPWYIGR